MNQEVLAYLPIVLAIIFAVGLVSVILILNYVIGPKRKTAVKQAPFECGNESIRMPSGRIPVKYYLVALFFLIFDVEIMFLLPWAVRFRKLVVSHPQGWLLLIEVLLFVVLLTVGLIYVVGRKALKWE